MISRSFGDKVTELAQLHEALATYTSMACEKLRKQASVAGGFYVFLRTGLYGLPKTVYKNSIYTTMPTPSSDTRVIMRYAKQALNRLFKTGYRYQKVGIILCGLLNINNMQTDLDPGHPFV